MATPGCNTTIETVGVVLAGGRSRRMGRDKAQLSWQKEDEQVITWLDHAVFRLQGVCDRVVVSGRPEQDLPPGVISVPDQSSGHDATGGGPLAGISTVLAANPGQVCVFLPIDMVRVTPHALVKLGQSASTDCPHICYANSFFPMRLQSTADCREQLQALLALEDPQARSVKALIHRLGSTVVTLAAEPAEQFINANSPQDLTRYRLPTRLDDSMAIATGIQNQRP